MNGLADRLLAAVLAEWPDTAVEVKKTQISLRAGYIFACISMAGKSGVRLTFSLPYRVGSGRIAQASEPYPMRWTHHVLIKDESQINAEIMGWLNEAREFAMNK